MKNKNYDEKTKQLLNLLFLLEYKSNDYYLIRNKIVEMTITFIDKFIKSYYFDYEDIGTYEDFINEGILSLINSIDNLKNNDDFFDFMYKNLKKDINNYIRLKGLFKQTKKEFENKEIETYNTKITYISELSNSDDIIYEEDSPYHVIDSNDKYKQLLSILTNKEQVVIHEKIKGVTIKTICSMLDKSHSTVFNTKNRGLRKLKKILLKNKSAYFNDELYIEDLKRNIEKQKTLNKI